MLTVGARPRNLKWFHAGPMLFGDWGTSRLYVLGLALLYTQYASFYFMLAMSVILLAVGWAYTVVCRLYPDGGGVYSSAKERSQTLAVVGAFLLCADYVVTAAISAVEAFHYAGFHHEAWWAAGAILAIGVLNYFGPTKAGSAALYVAVATMVLSLIISVAALPYLGEARLERPTGEPVEWWTNLTHLILAISGVEAIANMTSIMVTPVQRTASRAIWPVLLEIVVLNVILTAAMLAVPESLLHAGDSAAGTFDAHKETMMKLLADYYVGPTFAQVSAIVFALLLLSAVNTAITGLVSVLFTLSEDNELPRAFGGLNIWGMPVLPLIIGTVLPTITVLMVPRVADLADLYAIGVVGAVAVNLGSISTNFRKKLPGYERWPMLLIAVVMVAIWVTIALTKFNALLFATSVMGFGFGARYLGRHREEVFDWVKEAVPGLPTAAEAVGRSVSSFLKPGANYGAANAPDKTRILIATTGNPKLVDFALDECKLRQGSLYVLFVRHIAVGRFAPVGTPNVDSDFTAAALFEGISAKAEEKGVAVHFLYAVSYDIGDTILEMAVTHGVDFVILGATQRGALWRTMKGDVIRQVAQDLPSRISLLLHG
jgi:amino acid transporter